MAAAGYPFRDRDALGSPGYRELGEYLSGLTDLDEAVARTKTQTHRMARRQYTWFKLGNPRIHWLDAGAEHVEGQAAALVTAFLEANPPVLQ